MSELLEKDAVDILVEAKLYVEKGWIQNTFGRVEREGEFLNVGSPRQATHVCALGAIAKASEAVTWAVYSESASEATSLLATAATGLRYETASRDAPTAVSQWNDARYQTQAGVAEGFDKAIALALERS